MILIKEENKNKQTVYLCFITKDNNEVLYKRVGITSAECEDKNEKLFMWLYSSNISVIRDVFRYVNYEIGKQAYNSKSLAIQALRILFAYLEIFKISYKGIDMNEALRLKDFLYGNLPPIGVSIGFELSSKRSADTVNSYFGVYRKFFEYLGIKNAPFNLKNVKDKPNVTNKPNGSKNEEKETYKLSDKSQRDKRRVPMYIKVHEIRNILKIVRSKYTLRDEMIIRLMYECGLRIGEALGLTLEDIEAQYTESKELGTIILRNRLTDKRFQLCKGCMTVNDSNDYIGKPYNTENVGYQKVSPSMILISKLDKYIDDAHGIMSDKVRTNYLKYAKADKVTKGEYLEGGNYYVFLNKDGKPLGISGWNNRLRKIYTEAGLGVDTGVKEHNLSHRMRHGYAMFLRKYQGASEVDLMYGLRHSSTATVGIYFRPDDEDIYESNYQAVLSMYDICPDLKI